MDLPNNIWLTVNRQCNIRCEWCYAAETKYTKEDEMTLEYAQDVVDTMYWEQTHNIIILGGEPTLWQPLPDLIKWINEKYPDVTVTVVTNGIRFASEKYMESLADCVYRVGMSLKAANKQQQIDLTKTDTFDQALKAITNLSQKDILYGISVTINSKMLGDLVELSENAKNAGAQSISFEMCAPSFDTSGGHNDAYAVHPKVMAQTIVDTYDAIDKIFDGNVAYQLSLPFCLFDQDFIDNLKDRSQIISGCHVMQRNGVIVTSNGNILMCNCLHHIPIGRFGTDFTDDKSFEQWWNREEVVNCNKELLRYPSVKCIGCHNYNECCGGCPLQWFAFYPQEIIP